MDPTSDHLHEHDSGSLNDHSAINALTTARYADGHIIEN
jgi:hypothetical protein